MKHSPISLLERAAEHYGLGAALRVPSDIPIPPEPASPEFASPELAPQEPVPPADLAAPAAPLPFQFVDPPQSEAPRPSESEIPARGRGRGGQVRVDRARLGASGHIDPEAPSTGLAEEFRLIKRQLLSDIERRSSVPIEKRRSILICSGQPREGKSFCALNLALSLSGEQGIEVLLIDADFNKPDLLAKLGVDDPGTGLVDALTDPFADPEDHVLRTDVRGLSLLPAGRKINNVPELLASERTREVLARLSSERRILLFDSPPALMASPASLLAGLVGQALVVVRADQTSEADLRETVGLLSGCDHVGLLLNAAAINVSGRNYGSYHGYSHED